MAIGRTFEESIQKALRMTHPALDGFGPKVSYSCPLYMKSLRFNPRSILCVNLTIIDSDGVGL